MAVKEGAAPIELTLIGATESDKPLVPGGFAGMETDGVGTRAITYGRTTALWDLATGHRIAGDGWRQLHPDGRRGLREEAGGAVAICDIASGEPGSTLEGIVAGRLPTLGPGELVAGAIRAEAPADGPMPFSLVWDLRSGKRTRTIEQPHVLGAYLPGERLLMIGPRGAPSVWDLTTGELAFAMKGPAGQPSKLRVSRDGKTAVTVSAKRVTNVWDLEAQRLAVSSDALAKERGIGSCDHFELLADGRKAVLGSRPAPDGDLLLGVMDLASGALDLSWTTADEGREIRELVVFPDAAQVAISIARSASAPIVLEVWDVAERLLLGAIDARVSKALAVTANRRVVIAGSGAWGGPHYFRVYAAEPRPGSPLPAQPPAAIRSTRTSARGPSPPR